MKHAFVSGIADGGDAALVRPTNWNADHVETLATVADAGASEVLMLATATTWDVTMSQSCTFTFTGFVNGIPGSLLLYLRENGTGGWAPTFTGVTWQGGAAPDQSATASTCTRYIFDSLDGGTTIYGRRVDVSSLAGDAGEDVLITAANDATVGRGITLTTGDNAAGDGGLLTLQGGTGAGGAGDGGNIAIYAGPGNDKGGDIDLTGGAGVTDHGGNIDLQAGGTDDAGSHGGTSALTGGSNTGGAYYGAQVTAGGGFLAAHGKATIFTGGTLGNDGDLLVSDSSDLNYEELISTAAGAPGGTRTTNLYFDTTAGTGGLYAWNGSAYARIDLNATVDAAGDLLVGTGADTVGRLAKGADADVLTISASTHLPVWAAPAAGGVVGCSIYRTTDQVIGTTSATNIAYDAEAFDSAGFHDNSTNNTRITIPANLGGVYLVGWAMELQAVDDTEFWQSYLTLNGTGTKILYGIDEAYTGSAGVDRVRTMSTVVALSAGDYIELTVYQSHGSNRSVYTRNAAHQSPTFYAMRMGA